ncbi:TetR family transcriptional regulator [Agrobacterium rhizogenes]|uniref:Transcriptional regulator protein n=3 Tax=Rhizobium rhizogenes TaxID=359 RepID=B9J9B0_RHIR8|nr:MULTISPECIES: TetR/AcrR family transcriptional regulator [Rhizobium]ACM25512.1 transcriptional regulator protein [Rhizobium rhizogenes K84]KAA6483605.1 TetR family transcriptional regulator [Agrobacterium sp. ICMP 7243]OCI98128.1 transcriptional regulator [Agrobacterium sp. 13-626]OCJ21852.1 transcriptional regulator [Agrobacterium sp. B131/95]OCJ26704.1 transcriptional regulator [Agrobacterium sp. B133/95]
MHDAPSKPEGLRERKRRLTFQRIADVGMKSFLAKGYQETTLDEIAAAAGISRRTFFYYFKSKNEILLAHQRGYIEALKTSVLESASAGRPLEIVHQALRKLIERVQTSQLLAVARLLRQSDALRVRTRSDYLGLEQAVYESLCELFPAMDRDELRLISMISVSPLRLAVNKWLQEDGQHPLMGYLEDALRKFRTAV